MRWRLDRYVRGNHKKAIVAVARQLVVDPWRLFTGQTTAQNLRLIYLPEASRAPAYESRTGRNLMTNRVITT